MQSRKSAYILSGGQVEEIGRAGKTVEDLWVKLRLQQAVRAPKLASLVEATITHLQQSDLSSTDNHRSDKPLPGGAKQSVGDAMF